MPHLQNGYAELRVDMPGLDLGVAPADNVWVQADAAFPVPAVGMAELLQDRDIVNVDDQPHIHTLSYLIEGDTVGREKNLRGIEARLHPQPGLLDGDDIQACPRIAQQAQYAQVGQGLCRIFDLQIQSLEC